MEKNKEQSNTEINEYALPDDLSGYLKRCPEGNWLNGGHLVLKTPKDIDTRKIVNAVLEYIDTNSDYNFQADYSEFNVHGIGTIPDKTHIVHTSSGREYVSLRVEMGKPPEFEGPDVEISSKMSPPGISDNYLDELFKQFLVDNGICKSLSEAVTYCR